MRALRLDYFAVGSTRWAVARMSPEYTDALEQSAEPVVKDGWRLMEVGDSVVIDNRPAVEEAKTKDEPNPELRYVVLERETFDALCR